MKKELKGIRFTYKREAQTLTIETLERDEISGEVSRVTGKIKVNKTYMFSTFIFIGQVMRRMFMHKRVMNKLKKLEKLEEEK